MDRAELEVRLLDDEELRAKLLALKEAQKKMREAEAAHRLARGHFHSRIKDLVNDVGIPVASIARWTSLQPQTVTQVLRRES